MTKEIITYCITFLAGVFTGAAASYLGNKYTDRRREQETRKKKRSKFREVQQQMPELIAEMHKDLDNPELQCIREFFVSKREYILNPGGPCFVYYENNHPNLQGKVHILENSGYVIDVTPGNAPKYRMTEEFVNLVLESR